MKAPLFAILALMLCSFAAEHKFYMSLTDVHHNQEGHTLELTTRFFTDDVERAISTDDLLLTIDESMDEELLPLLAEFYSESLSITWDQREQQIEFLGYEVSNELLWCYAEVRDIEQGEEMNVEGAWLFDRHQDQVNIINVHIGEVQSAYLNPDRQKHSFSLDR